jgi:hypothetical protein
MYIDKKYFYLQTGEDVSYLGGSPAKFYVDWWFKKPNMKFNWRDSSEFYFEFGIPSTTVTGTIRWGFVERERTEHEEDMYQTTLRFLKDLENTNPEDIEIS